MENQRAILGLIPYDVGEIKIQNVLVNPNTQMDVASITGYVIQEGGLFPHLTANQNVRLGAQIRGWSGERISQRIEELRALVKLERELMGHYPNELSGGQRQRLGLMRAMVIDPKYLLLDEPLGALDPLVRFNLQNDLKRIFNTVKKTVLIVTHDIGEAAFFGHTISLLHEGKLIQHGTFMDLLKSPVDSFVTEFISAQRPPTEFKEVL